MEEIKAGEYVRTNRGNIDKVIIDYNGRCNNSNCNRKHISCKYDYYNEEDITKHSFNIIDLIEVGDIYEVYFPIKKITRKIYVDQYFQDSMILNGIINGNIILKKILTHQQFEINCYKIDTK